MDNTKLIQGVRWASWGTRAHPGVWLPREPLRWGVDALPGTLRHKGARPRPLHPQPHPRTLSNVFLKIRHTTGRAASPRSMTQGWRQTHGGHFAHASAKATHQGESTSNGERRPPHATPTLSVCTPLTGVTVWPEHAAAETRSSLHRHKTQ